ncbi:hypothetical protein [Sediminibacillus massiliensis]|uniref:hypothetical protein n=1 Tax=Sediminibacillus massiliensis TaxID=1926277 RepID=UPI001178544C|nr:hypothetical protein [Sediminibacillus massiliensis]
MFVGRSLYIIGILFVVVSIVVMIMTFFADNVNPLIPLFALINGLMAMGIGDIVIDLNHRKRLEKN